MKGSNTQMLTPVDEKTANRRPAAAASDPASARKRVGGLHFMIATAFCFSVMSLMVKVLGKRLPTAEIVFFRAIVTLAISYAMVRAAGIPARGKRPSLLILRGLAGFGALYCFFYAVTRLPLADVTVIHFTNPVFTAVLAAAFLGEPMGRRELVGLPLCLIGVAFVAQPSFLFGEGARSLDMVAVCVALTAALLSSVAYTTVRKLRDTDELLVIVLYFPLVAAPASLPFVALSHPVWPNRLEWLLLVGVGAITQAGQIFLTKGLHLERAGRATSMSYIQVVFAALWGFLFFRDVPNWLAVAGAALILAGMLLVSRARIEALSAAFAWPVQTGKKIFPRKSPEGR
jgi:drug/metabolite transporter (DMT)-like permease